LFFIFTFRFDERVKLEKEEYFLTKKHILDRQCFVIFILLFVSNLNVNQIILFSFPINNILQIVTKIKVQRTMLNTQHHACNVGSISQTNFSINMATIIIKPTNCMKANQIKFRTNKFQVNQQQLKELNKRLYFEFQSKIVFFEILLFILSVN
jgi:hypothetical protein